MSGAIVIGAGPGLGAAIARRLAGEGLPVALIARHGEAIGEIAAEISAREATAVALTADAADEGALRSALDQAIGMIGPPECVVYNAAVIRADAPGELSGEQLLSTFAVNVVGALTAATHVATTMASVGRGSFLVTSGMPEPSAAYTSLSLGKAAVRALVDILGQQYGPLGVHVATVTVLGEIAPGTRFDPDAIADHYWTLHQQPREAWQYDIRHGGET